VERFWKIGEVAKEDFVGRWCRDEFLKLGGLRFTEVGGSNGRFRSRRHHHQRTADEHAL
jgi:hypothetical protein